MCSKCRMRTPAKAEFNEEGLKRITMLDLGESNFRVITMCLDVLPELKNLSFKKCQSLQALVFFKSEFGMSPIYLHHASPLFLCICW